MDNNSAWAALRDELAKCGQTGACLIFRFWFCCCISTLFDSDHVLVILYSLIVVPVLGYYFLLIWGTWVFLQWCYFSEAIGHSAVMIFVLFFWGN
jgi:hypothetical protein